MQTLTDKRLAKIKAKREQANAEPKKTNKTSKKSTANADNTKEV